MNAAEFEQLERAFEDSQSLDGAARAAILQNLGGPSSAIGEKLVRMLSSDEADAAAAASLLRAAADQNNEGSQTIGPYRILGTLGEGGWGVVYLAEQPPPMRRLVALKVIKPGLDTHAALARFNDERQALAVMDHPCIVGAMDAGATAEGRPFVVMPLVPGIPLTQFCLEEKLSIDECLILLVKVCRGIEYAHAKGVIHRDLKPANILVSRVDGVPLPRIIDFGLAKALHAPLTEHATVTLRGQPVGTPDYMSPEQARGLEADVRSDVYALGALLYEILAGRPPFDPKSLRRQGPEELRRILNEVLPVPPSAYAPREIRRELDWITLRCLEKDPNRRYPTAAALADDLDRFLRGDPVEAGPPAKGYRAWRWLLRHRAFVLSALAIGFTLIAGASVATMYAVRERAQREEAQEITRFVQDMFSGLDPMVAAGRDRQLLQMALDEAQARLGAKFHPPQVEASLLYTLGTARYRIGDVVVAEPMLERSWMLFQQMLGSEAPETLRAEMECLAARTDLRDNPVHTLAQSQDCMRRLERTFGPRSREALRHIVVLTYAEFYGKSAMPGEEADKIDILTLARSHRDRAESIADPDDPDVIRVRYRVARILETSEASRAEALLILQETKQRVAHRFGVEHPLYFYGLSTEMVLLRRAGRFAEVADLGDEDLRRAEVALGPRSTLVLTAKNNVAFAIAQIGRMPEAMALQTQVIEQARRVLGDDHEYVRWFARQRGYLMVQEGHPDEAVAYRWGWSVDDVKRVNSSAAYAYELLKMTDVSMLDVPFQQWKEEWNRRRKIEGLPEEVEPPRPGK